MKKIVICPGGFHPFHAGHYSLYQAAKKKFPDADIYLAATDDTKNRPFPFEIKKKLAQLAGVDPNQFIQVKSPFKAEEITKNYNPEQDMLIFVRSEKDRTEQPKPGGTKKDGSPSYFQPYNNRANATFAKHAYIDYLPTVEFGPGIKSATEIRNSWPKLNKKQKLAMVLSLYPKTQKNKKLADIAVKMLDAGIVGEQAPQEISESIVLEGKGHLEHPEDLVFLEGIPGANRALASIINTIRDPAKITLKFDGYPALIFGRDQQGRFSIMDKHMFNKKDGTGRQVFSPQEFVEYDRARGANRGDLYNIITTVWPGLEKADRNKGYYWGDLLFSNPLQEKNGMYSFKANPNGIAYTVSTDSEVGKLMKGKQAGIAVHQFIPATAVSTDDAQSLDGSLGKLKNNSNVAIVPSKMPITPNLKINNTLKSKAEQAINTNKQAVQQLLDTSPQQLNVYSQNFTTFVNRKIVSGDLNNLVDDFVTYVVDRAKTETAKIKIKEHLEQNMKGIVGIFKIWIAIYNLKMNVVNQLNKSAKSSPVQGYLDDGTQTQEGFVSQGLKFVDRMGFSRQNLAGRTAVTEKLQETVSSIKTLLPQATPKQKVRIMGILKESVQMLKKIRETDETTPSAIKIDRNTSNLTSDETQVLKQIIRQYPEAKDPLSAIVKYVIHSIDQSDQEDAIHNKKLADMERAIKRLEKEMDDLYTRLEVIKEPVTESTTNYIEEK
jgi:hypothetical protein